MQAQAVNTLRVLLAIAHTSLRTAFRELVESVDGVQIVGEARSGREALAAAQALSPDVVLVDLRLPDLGGLDTVSLLVRQMPETRVILLGDSDEPEYRAAAIGCGASAYLPKLVAAERLRQSLISLLS